jgi:hypothetical protein
MQISAVFSKKIEDLIRRRTSKLLCLGILLTGFLWLSVNLYKDLTFTYIRREGLRDIRISSTEYPYFSYLVDKQDTAVFKKKSLFYKTASPLTDMPHYNHYTFTFLYEDRRQIHLHYSPTLNEVYNKDHLLEPSTGLKEVLLDFTAIYGQEVYKTYGALLVWEKADKIFPMYATARITDIYTGASFNVQRREGCCHVDAQPLTAEDTAVMKKIYGGRWSWERKGIIVEVPGYRIAASMAGMPHGAGKIDDNNFPGHFCIHFLGSTIHNGGMDIRHHREILKAAGKLPLDDF